MTAHEEIKACCNPVNLFGKIKRFLQHARVRAHVGKMFRDAAYDLGKTPRDDSGEPANICRHRGVCPLLATLPTPGSIAGEERIESIDALRWTLSNGITMIAKQTDFRNDEVVFRTFSPGGHSLVVDEDHVSALYAAQLVSGSGVGLLDNVTLDKLLAGKRVSVSPYIGELFEGLRGDASPENLETLFQLITPYGTAPRLDPVAKPTLPVQRRPPRSSP